MVTTTDVEVLELCSNTVASTPIIRPATGLRSSLLSDSAAPITYQRGAVSSLTAIDTKLYNATICGKITSRSAHHYHYHRHHHHHHFGLHL